MLINEKTSERFLLEIQKYEKREKAGGIGTLNEKMLHSVLKSTLSGEKAETEVQIDGHNIADFIENNTVYEVQTERLFPVKKKLEYYLSETCFDIDIIFPISKNKCILWVDPESGEITYPKRKGGEKRLIDEIDEIKYVAPFLQSGRVTLTVLYIAEEELRNLDGKRSKDKKRGSTRIERRPTALLGGEELRRPEDFAFLLPHENVFTRRSYSKEKKLRSERKVYSALSIMIALGLCKVKGREKRAYIYELTEGGITLNEKR